MNDTEKVEYLDVLNESGNITGIVKMKEEIKRDNDYYRIVFLWIYNPRVKKILVQRRSKYKETAPDKWDFSVGGHIQAGESSIDAVIRETKEEIGIDINGDSLTKILEVKPSQNKTKFQDVYFLIKEIGLDEIKLQSEEVSEVKYFSLEELIDKYNSSDPDFIKHSFFPKLVHIVRELIN